MTIILTLLTWAGLLACWLSGHGAAADVASWAMVLVPVCGLAGFVWQRAKFNPGWPEWLSRGIAVMVVLRLWEQAQTLTGLSEGIHTAGELVTVAFSIVALLVCVLAMIGGYRDGEVFTDLIIADWEREISRIQR